jgi:hypothetical protein
VTGQAGGIGKLDLRGLVYTITSSPRGVFPFTHPEFCVYLVLTGGVGTGRCQVIVVEGDTGQHLFGSPEHQLTYPANRLLIRSVVFRLRRCVFPQPGLYWVEFHHEGMPLQSEPLIVR